jgi:Signal transduction histidine kinase
VRKAEDGWELTIRVTDNGLGVPVDNRERLFERYYRAHEEAHSNISGTGLGLSIVKETVTTLGGKAWAEFPEVGTVFAFSIPTRRDTDPAPDSAAPSAAQVTELRDRIGADQAERR